MPNPVLVLSSLLLGVSAWVETPGGNGAGGLLPVRPSTQLQTAPNSSAATWTLPGGVEYPLLAINTADLSVEAVDRAVRLAWSHGLRSVDFHLGDEREGLSRALAAIPRQDLFLTTKLDKPPANMTDPLAAAALARRTLDDELGALGVASVDMLLLKDSATCEVMQAQWAVLEEMLAAGRARALGTYNYCEFSLSCLLANATTPPAVNYLMRHVGMGADATGIIAFGAAHGIRTAAYGTLGEPVALPELLSSPTLGEIADAHGRSVEEVALRWNFQAGFAISSRITADYAPDNAPPHGFCTEDCGAAIAAMAQVDDWALTQAEVAQLDALRLEQYPQSPTYYSSTGCANSFGVSDHPTASACSSSLPRSSWC